MGIAIRRTIVNKENIVVDQQKSVDKEVKMQAYMSRSPILKAN